MSTSHAPLILALDTATPIASVALAGARSGLVTRQLSARNHGPSLLPAIEALLAEAGVTARDLDAVVCGRGPGSFTGLRIGLATAKGLCFALGVPLITPSSLLALAHGLPTPAALVAPCFDARRQELFAALYERRDGEASAHPLVERLPPMALGPQGLAERLAAIATPARPVHLLGTGVALYRDELGAALGDRACFDPAAPTTPDARILARLGASLLARGEVADLVSVEPDYLRPSDAEITRDQLLAAQGDVGPGDSEGPA